MSEDVVVRVGLFGWRAGCVRVREEEGGGDGGVGEGCDGHVFDHYKEEEVGRRRRNSLGLRVYHCPSCAVFICYLYKHPPPTPPHFHATERMEGERLS